MPHLSKQYGNDIISLDSYHVTKRSINQWNVLLFMYKVFSFHLPMIFVVIIGILKQETW